MARIENTSGRQCDVTSLPKGAVLGQVFCIPRAVIAEGTVNKTNGVGEIPDDVLDELLTKDKWTQGLFASGDLVRAGSAHAGAESSKAKGKGESSK